MGWQKAGGYYPWLGTQELIMSITGKLMTHRIFLAENLILNMSLVSKPWRNYFFSYNKVASSPQTV